MQELSEKRWSPRPVNYVGCYALYALLVVLGVTVLFIWPTTVVALIGAFIGLSEANELIYMLSNLLLGLSLFVLVMAGEPYLRHGVQCRPLGHAARASAPYQAHEVHDATSQTLSPAARPGLGARAPRGLRRRGQHAAG